MNDNPYIPVPGPFTIEETEYGWQVIDGNGDVAATCICADTASMTMNLLQMANYPCKQDPERWDFVDGEWVKK